MKRFNIVKDDNFRLVSGKYHIPKNCVYGKYELPWRFAGIDQPGITPILYYIDDFTTYKSRKGRPYFRIHVYNQYKDRWITTNTAVYLHKPNHPSGIWFRENDRPTITRFHNFLADLFARNQLDENTVIIKPQVINIPMPSRREVPVYSDISTHPYKTVYGAAFSDYRTPVNYAEDGKTSACHDITTSIRDTILQNIQTDDRSQISGLDFQKKINSTVTSQVVNKQVEIKKTVLNETKLANLSETEIAELMDKVFTEIGGM